MENSSKLHVQFDIFLGVATYLVYMYVFPDIFLHAFLEILVIKVTQYYGIHSAVHVTALLIINYNHAILCMNTLV